jgi:hypothetical protein
MVILELSAAFEALLEIPTEKRTAALKNKSIKVKVFFIQPPDVRAGERSVPILLPKLIPRCTIIIASRLILPPIIPWTNPLSSIYARMGRYVLLIVWQWAVGSGQWAVGSGQWAVGSGQWAVNERNHIFLFFAS